MSISNRYFKLFYHNQDSYYVGGYSADFEPFETEEGKLKFPNKTSDGRLTTWHRKSAFDEDEVIFHLVANRDFYQHVDEHGKGNNSNFVGYQKPVVNSVNVGKHKVMETGDYGVVLNPLGETGDGIFGAIDVDTYNDPNELDRVIKEIYNQDIPLVPCHSKSGGLHLYLFSSISFTYTQIDNALKYFRKKLNIKAKEIFPKQARTINPTTKKPRPGNAIALPYRSTILLYEGNKHKEDFYDQKNVMAKPDGSKAKITEFLDHAEKMKAKCDENFWNNLPIMEITKDKKDKKEVNQAIQNSQPINDEEYYREPSKICNAVMTKIIEGKEHKRGGTFDNYIVDFVYTNVVTDKRTDSEIKKYYELIKHRADPSKREYQDDNYLQNKIDNCREKYNKPDPAPKIIEFFNNTIWDCETDEYLDIKKNKKRSSKSLNKIHYTLFPENTSAEKEFDRWENKKVVEANVYRPDLHNPNNYIIEDNGLKFLNKFRPGTLTPLEATMGDLKPFTDLMEYLFPNEKERNHVLDFLACVVQRPAVKIRHAILVYSEDWQIGKGSLFEVMTNILGEDNAEPGSVRSILDKGISFSEKLLVLIDECSSTGEYSEKRNLVNDLKTIISEKRLQKRQLYKDYGVTKQFTNFLIFTNKKDALSIDAKDPRYFVTENLAQRKDQKFYKEFHKWRLEDGNKGSRFVMHYLLNRDISKFDPEAPAPLTDAKRNMANESAHPLFADMEQRYNEGQMPFPFNQDIRGTSEIAEWYKRFGTSKLQTYASNPKVIVECFKKLGFHPLGQVLHKHRNEKPSLWIVRKIKYLKEQKATDLCNKVWQPLNLMQTNSDIKEERAINNLYQEINSPENVKRLMESASHE